MEFVNFEAVRSLAFSASLILQAAEKLKRTSRLPGV